MYIVYCVFSVYFFDLHPGLASHIWYGLLACSSQFGDIPEHRYINIYQCSGVSLNCDEQVGNPHKKGRANPDADSKKVQKIYNTHAR